MSNLNDIFTADNDLENNGFLYSYPKTDLKFTVARAGGTNIEYRKVLGEVTQKFVDFSEGEFRLSAEDDLKAMIEVYSRTIIRGWENLEVDGVAVPFSVENCITVLTRFPQLYYDISLQATNPNNYERDLEDVADAVAKK